LLSSSPRPKTILKSLKTIGVKPLANLALFRLGLASGHYRRVFSHLESPPDVSQIQPAWPLYAPDAELIHKIVSGSKTSILDRADGILEGSYPLFGGEPALIQLTPPLPLSDWTTYERGHTGDALGDIKFIWESARFCWAVNLAQAALLTGKKSYAEKFWQLLEEFLQNNPPFMGPNWVSAQESAIRIITACFALSVFTKESGFNESRRKMALEFLVMNARRIPPTLPYSRAQNNNHLLLEGAGLFTAGTILERYAESSHWKSLGWRIIQAALKDQIGADGEYCQHSLNYHRVMLQTVLWIKMILENSGAEFPEENLEKIRLATGWYLGMIDPTSGKAPNFGSNDSAWIFPLGSLDFSDHRPTAQAASRAFFGKPFFPAGEYDELAAWFSIREVDEIHPLPSTNLSDSYHRIGNESDWVVIRAATYNNRPFQADQLHVDLWHGGKNILTDAGTFSYNALPPWDNSLAGGFVHNTATIDGMDQMTRAGRFLWLDWAQGWTTFQDSESCEAFHDGYKKFDIRHSRRIQHLGIGKWDFLDTFSGNPESGIHEIILQWLLPDGDYEFEGNTLFIKFGAAKVRIFSKENIEKNPAPCELQLIRAGKLISGEGEAPVICGWYSPTYGQKIPALSFRIIHRSTLPLVTRTSINIVSPAKTNRSLYRCISS
jgi:hypothetical protein